MLRTRSSPTPCSVLPVSFALHTAPPHALLSCFPALIAPSSGHRRMGHQLANIIYVLGDARYDADSAERACVIRAFPAYAAGAAIPRIPVSPYAAEMELDGDIEDDSAGLAFRVLRHRARTRLSPTSTAPPSAQARTCPVPPAMPSRYTVSCSSSAGEQLHSYSRASTSRIRRVSEAPDERVVRAACGGGWAGSARPAYMHACGVHTRSPSLGCFTGVDEAGEDGGGTIILDEMPTALRGDRDIDRERQQRILQRLVLKLLTSFVLDTVRARILFK
ncbi:hypothetical protein B0H17DRAFT_1338653 [Mycena rosella]|uniref:Uncharacterized protein n=1 Tax=Mycena rosella TaxID=1033263 RepID=A0AAD7CLZ1_MYCRO|nr:hypothetical protein B0H17DRAFT_1338653 [Mycena rosella]